MKLHNLKPKAGSTKKRKRVGRGQGSGRGGTSTRGHNGAKSRSGYSAKLGFEGGQMPLQRRVPKFGFKNINRISYKVLNLDVLQNIVETHNVDTINFEFLVQKGIIGKKDLVKILGRGELTSNITVEVHGYSKSAKEAIEKLGGTANILSKK